MWTVLWSETVNQRIFCCLFRFSVRDLMTLARADVVLKCAIKKCLLVLR